MVSTVVILIFKVIKLTVHKVEVSLSIVSETHRHLLLLVILIIKFRCIDLKSCIILKKSALASEFN
jgi:hypothetical protein